MGFKRRNLLKAGLAGTAAVAGTSMLAACQNSDGEQSGGRSADTSVFDVAVIGGGISGLVAARDLKLAGLDNIVVLEARDRVGGRSFNQDLGNGQIADAGPTWVGPGQTAIADLLRQLNIGTIRNYDQGDAVIYMGGQTLRVPTTASPISDEGFFERIDALAHTVPISAPWDAEKAAEYDAMTYADYLTTQQLSPDDLLGLDIACQLTFGGKPQDLSFLYVLFYVHSAGGYALLESMEGGAQQDRIEGGTQAIPNKLAKELGPIVRTGQPVSTISNWGGAGPVLLDTPSGMVAAHNVILALSPSQATGISYSPALPADRAALMANWPRGGSAIKIAVAYDKPFWREDGLSGQSYSPDGPYLWAADVSPEDGSRGQIMSFTLSAAVPPLDSQQRKRALLDAYIACFGPQAGSPIGYAELDWSQETYTRGCVSPLTPGVLTSYGKALRPANGQLIWAGTETAEIWMGYMDGAVRAGHRAALEALGALAETA